MYLFALCSNDLRRAIFLETRAINDKTLILMNKIYILHQPLKADTYGLHQNNRNANRLKPSRLRSVRRMLKHSLATEHLCH
jgi:hypothetical protein